MDRNEPKRNVRLSVDLTEEDLMAIDDFRFASRFPSRAAAVRELLKIGMASGERPARKK
jgi:Arc/MetJ-type ribon-helix-helix transcriptional regulator